MAARRRSEALPWYVLLVMDVLSWVFSIVPACAAWLAAGSFLACELHSRWFWAAIIVAPAIAALTLIVSIFVLRLPLPRLKPGVYSPGLNATVLSWFVHVCLTRSVKVSLLWPVISSSHVLRFLYFRAMGGRIAFGVNTALDITLVDLPLISVGSGSTLAEHAHISAHVYVGNRLALKPVKLGKNVFLGMNSYLGPGTELDDGVWIGAGNRITGAHIPAGSKIDDRLSSRERSDVDSAE